MTDLTQVNGADEDTPSSILMLEVPSIARVTCITLEEMKVSGYML